MKNIRPTILAIHPGTRYLGVAVFQGPLLLDWNVHVLSAGSASAKSKRLETLISRYFREYEPDTLAIKMLHPRRSNRVLNRQCQKIYRLADRHGLAIKAYSINEVKAFLIPESRINKKALSVLISQRYPVLLRTLRKEQNALNPYHVRMFEAVALGIVCAYALKARKGFESASK